MPQAEAPQQVVATVEPARNKGPVGPIEQGTQLGSYEVLVPVARGGMASVWAGRTRGSGGVQDLVAIKTLLPELDDDPEFHKMFRDETRVASRIRHPNVAGLFAVGEHGETPYLVMEWVDGDTLAALLRAAKPLGGIPQGIVLRIASDTCSGLHAAHELKGDDGHSLDVVHRDITPANVLLTSGGQAKIVDFGVAKSKAQIHVTRVGGVVKGKTPYLSPEQLGGLPLDRRSDLFSLGTMLYVLTTGLHPFRGESDLKTLENIAIKKPVPLRSIVPWIDPSFETLVLKLLEKDPRQRLASAADVKAEIDRILETLDEPCGNGDVAAFLRKALGEQLDQRAKELKDAADTLDGRRSGAEPSKVVIAEARPLPPPAFADEPIVPPPAPVPEPTPTPAAPEPESLAPVAPPPEPEPIPIAKVPSLPPFGLATEPLDEAMARHEDTQRGRALMLRRRRMGQLVGLIVGASVIVIAAAAILSGGGDSSQGSAPSARPLTSTPKPLEPSKPPEPAPPPEVVTAEPVRSAEPAPSADAAPPPSTEPSTEPAPTTAPKPPPGPRPPTGPRPPPGPRPPRPPKKPPVYNPQGI
jgi:serine/threonine protein kinase